MDQISLAALLALPAVLVSGISVAMLIKGIFLKWLSKNIRPKYMGWYWLLLLIASIPIVWTWVLSRDLTVFLFNMRGVLVGIIVGLLSSKTRKPLAEIEERIWRKTMFYALFHG